MRALDPERGQQPGGIGGHVVQRVRRVDGQSHQRACDGELQVRLVGRAQLG